MDRCVKPLFSNESVFSLDSRQQPPGKQLPQLPSITLNYPPNKSEQLPFTVAYVQAYEFVCCKVFQQHMFDSGCAVTCRYCDHSQLARAWRRNSCPRMRPNERPGTT